MGKWFGTEVSAANKKQVWAPTGFARGFCVLSDYAGVQYECSGLCNNKAESGIRWDDRAIGIKWPTRSPLLSDKDRRAQTLTEWLNSPSSEHFKH
jgi:dTDP-4-dehydrorhamnose 3,5-epimerase